MLSSYRLFGEAQGGEGRRSAAYLIVTILELLALLGALVTDLRAGSIVVKNRWFSGRLQGN